MKSARDHTHAELAAQLDLDPTLFAYIHAAGYDAGRTAPGGFTAPAFRAANALLDAVDALPTHGTHILGQLITDPGPDLPDLGPGTGLHTGTPPMPDQLPGSRALLWEWADDELRGQLTAHPTANGWAAFPHPALIRDTYGVDPRPWAEFVVHSWQADRECHPYADAVDALARLAALSADTTARPDVGTLAELIDRSADGHIVPPGVTVRLSLLHAAGALRTHAAVELAVRARHARAGDDYPTRVRSSHDVPGDERDRLATLVDRSLPADPHRAELRAMVSPA